MGTLLVFIHLQAVATVQDEDTILIDVVDLQKNYFDLIHEKLIPLWSSELSVQNCHHPCLMPLLDQSSQANFQSHMPNPDCELAAGDLLYVSFVDCFGDNVSGNCTKSWNKHWNCYMTHRNLPGKLLNQEFHMHFISTSSNASVSEQFLAFKRIIE
jgi:hypothetical protein